MKKYLVLLALLLASGCATMSDQEPATPAKLVQKFCPLVQTLNVELLTIPGVDPSIKETIAKVDPMVAKVCEKGALITEVNLQTLLKDGVPLLLKLAKDEAIASTPYGQALMIAIPLAQIMIPQVIATVSLQK